MTADSKLQITSITVTTVIVFITIGLFTVVARIPLLPETYLRLLAATGISVSLYLSDSGRRIVETVAGISLSISIFAILGAFGTAFVWSAVALILWPINERLALTMTNLVNNNLLAGGAVIGIVTGILVGLTDCLDSSRSN